MDHTGFTVSRVLCGVNPGNILRVTKRLPPKTYKATNINFFPYILGANDEKQLWEEFASINFPWENVVFPTFSKSWKKLTPFVDPENRPNLGSRNPIR